MQVKVRKSVEFVLFLLKDCLMFERLEGDRMIKQTRKRFRGLNQICDQVDLLGLNASPKRLKTANNSNVEVNKPSNTYVCVFDESLNNNADKLEDEDEEGTGTGEKSANALSFQIHTPANTWQGRRAVKRQLKQKQATQVSELEMEKLTSQNLASLNPATGFKPINFKIDFQANAINDRDLSHLQVKFGLLDEIESQKDLLEFTTLVHFLDVYINNSREKLYGLWCQRDGLTSLRN